MSLPAPNLDDRTFQSLVDDAKRFVQRRCPDWTDHNVSDPGITLIEAFAWMTDVLLYRLNRVPDRNYVKFLELIGIQLLPPSAATVAVTFRLSSPQPTAVTIPAGTTVQAAHNGSAPIAFATKAESLIVPAHSRIVGSLIAGDEFRNHTPALGAKSLFKCFSDPPVPSDALYVGFDHPAPSCVVLVHVQCDVGGHGIDPHHPPLAWEAWNGVEWAACVVERDGTAGLNVSGDIELHLPDAHEVSEVNGHNAAWIRCQVIEAAHRRRYESSPTLNNVIAETVGVTADTIHAEHVHGESLGRSDGTPGQVFSVSRSPVLLEPRPVSLEVVVGETIERWTRVGDFADSRPDDRHFMLDATSGEVRFGPVIRTRDGGLRHCGAVPQKSAEIRVVEYWVGGGRAGNVAARTLTVLQSSIPYVNSVYNRLAARGGVDGETIDEARRRGPIELRTRNRAVTAQDFEILGHEIAPELARVHCALDESEGGAPLVRLLVVPSAPAVDGRLRFEHMVPTEATLGRIHQHLDARRLVGTRLVIEPPSYIGLSVTARIRARGSAIRAEVERAALTALYLHFNPIAGGPDGRGWPFGRGAQVGETFSVLQQLDGVDVVEEVLLHVADPRTHRRGNPVEYVDVGTHTLVFSVDHEIELV